MFVLSGVGIERCRSLNRLFNTINTIWPIISFVSVEWSGGFAKHVILERDCKSRCPFSDKFFFRPQNLLSFAFIRLGDSRGQSRRLLRRSRSITEWHPDCYRKGQTCIENSWRFEAKENTKRFPLERWRDVDWSINNFGISPRKI